MAIQVRLPPLGKRPLSGRVYDALKSAIIAGQIPAGAKLTESNVAQTLGVSPTPVREAFQRLAAEGFLAIAPWRGATVQPFSEQDVVETYQCREMLEGLACRLAAERIDAPGIAELRRLLGESRRARTAASVVELNSRIHEVMLRYAGNQKLKAMLALLQDMIMRDRNLTADSTVRRSQIQDEHRAVLAALERRDPDAAEQAMRRHVRNGFAYRRRVAAPGPPPGDGAGRNESGRTSGRATARPARRQA